jgi:hypothetical protein
MMIETVGITALIIVVPSLCLGLVLWASARHARRSRQSTHLYTAVSLAGWLVGMIGGPVGMASVNEWLELRGLIPVEWFPPAAMFGALFVGAFVGASGGYFWLRIATRLDPYYDDARDDVVLARRVGVAQVVEVGVLQFEEMVVGPDQRPEADERARQVEDDFLAEILVEHGALHRLRTMIGATRDAPR